MESICQEAHRLTNGDRNHTYGHPFDDFTHAAAIAAAILKMPIRPEHIPFIMFAVKIARESHLHKRDNLVDIAGYANTLAMFYEESDRREKAHAAFDEMVSIGEELGLYGTEATSTEDDHDTRPPGRRTVESSLRATGHAG